MAEKQFELSGKSGVFALIAVVLFVGFRFYSFDKNTDPDLKAEVMTELRNEMGGALQKRMNQSVDESDLKELTDMADSDRITIYSIYVSKPILSFSSNQKAIVKVDFRLPQGSRQTKYYEFKHGLIGGWNYRYQSNSYAYYSNFF